MATVTMGDHGRVFSGSTPTVRGWTRHASIYRGPDGYSVFAWHEHYQRAGVTDWREDHGRDWPDAFRMARDWLASQDAPNVTD